MDGITYEQFQSVFGDFGKELKDSNTNSLEKLQAFIGSKIDGLETSIKKFESIADYLKGLKEPKEQKKDAPELNKIKESKKKKDESKTESILDILPTTASKVISASTKLLPVRVVDDAKKRTPVDLYIPAETKVWIENLLYDTLDHLLNEIKSTKKETKKEEKPKDEKKSWVDKLLAGLMGASFIGKLLGGIMKPFTWLAGKLLKFLPSVIKDVGKLLFPVVRGLLGSVGPLLAGAGLAIGGIVTLLSGLKDSGPYKGIKKVLGKGLLASGTALLKKEFGKLGKLVLDASKSLTKGGFVRNFIAGVTKGFRGIMKNISALPGKVFGGITKAFTGMFSGLAGKATGAIAKGGGKGLIAKLAGTAGKFLLKGLKRLPLIGTLIGLGFAISRIMKGDFIGGALDIASAIAASVPVVGTALSIAIDLFSAYRDTQTGGSEKAGKAQMNWMSNAWKWVKDSFMKIPLIRHLTDMGTHISEGKYGEAFMDIATLIPGVSFLVELFNQEKAAVGELATSGKPITFSSVLKATGGAIIKAILNMLPESILGVSIRSRVAKMLGIEGYGSVDDKKEIVSPGAAKITNIDTKRMLKKKDEEQVRFDANDEKLKNAIANFKKKIEEEKQYRDDVDAGKISLKEQQSHKQFAGPYPINITPKDTPVTPTANIQPAETKAVPDTSSQPDGSADNDEEMVGNQKEHTILLKGLFEYQKQTAINTKAFLEALKSQAKAGGNVSVANISNPTTFVSSSMTSPAFRQGILQR